MALTPSLHFVSVKRFAHCFKRFFYSVSPALLFLFFACSPNSSTPPIQPDVVILTLDTLRADATGFGGFPGPITPTLDRIAHRSTIYSRAYTAIPITNASHATIMTGVQPARHECRGFGRPLGDAARTIAEYLKEEGYSTCAFLSGYPLERQIARLDRGFDRYDDEWMKGQSTVDRSAGETVDAAIRHLDTISSGQPVFIWIHFFDPHKPYDPPTMYGKRFDSDYTKMDALHHQTMTLQMVAPPVNKNNAIDSKHDRKDQSIDPEIAESSENDDETPPNLDEMWARYCGETAYMDHEIARFLRYWQDHRGLKKTKIVIVADHGESFEKGYYFRHVHRLFESIIHVPLVLFNFGSQDSRIDPLLTATRDIAPTILASLNQMPVMPMEGRNLMDSRRWTIGETPESAFSETQPTAKPSWGGPYISAVLPHLKLIQSTHSRQMELYDLNTDPGETINLLDDLKNSSDRRMQIEQSGDVLEIKRLLSEFESNQKLQTVESSNPSDALDEQSQEKLKSLGYLK